MALRFKVKTLLKYYPIILKSETNFAQIPQRNERIRSAAQFLNLLVYFTKIIFREDHLTPAALKRLGDESANAPPILVSVVADFLDFIRVLFGQFLFRKFLVRVLASIPVRRWCLRGRASLSLSHLNPPFWVVMRLWSSLSHFKLLFREKFL